MQGLEEVRGIAQECGGDLALVVNHSGGKTLHECWDSFAISFRKPNVRGDGGYRIRACFPNHCRRL